MKTTCWRAACFFVLFLVLAPWSQAAQEEKQPEQILARVEPLLLADLERAALAVEADGARLAQVVDGSLRRGTEELVARLRTELEEPELSEVLGDQIPDGVGGEMILEEAGYAAEEIRRLVEELRSRDSEPVPNRGLGDPFRLDSDLLVRALGIRLRALRAMQTLAGENSMPVELLRGVQRFAQGRVDLELRANDSAQLQDRTRRKWSAWLAPMERRFLERAVTVANDLSREAMFSRSKLALEFDSWTKDYADIGFALLPRSSPPILPELRLPGFWNNPKREDFSGLEHGVTVYYIGKSDERGSPGWHIPLVDPGHLGAQATAPGDLGLERDGGEFVDYPVRVLARPRRILHIEVLGHGNAALPSPFEPDQLSSELAPCASLPADLLDGLSSEHLLLVIQGEHLLTWEGGLSWLRSVEVQTPGLQDAPVQVLGVFKGAEVRGDRGNPQADSLDLFWRNYLRRGENGGVKLENDQDFIVVSIKMPQGVPRTTYNTRIHGAGGDWHYPGNINATIRFLRAREDHNRDDRLTYLLLHDRVKVEIELSHPMPLHGLTRLAFRLARNGKPFPDDKTVHYAYRDARDPRLYTSRVFHLGAPGGGSFRRSTDVELTGFTIGDTAQARLLPLAAVLPRGVALAKVISSPDRVAAMWLHGVWSALRATGKYEDLSEEAFNHEVAEKAARGKSEELVSQHLFGLTRSSVQLTVGDVAAMILLRDTFLQMMGERIKYFEQMLVRSESSRWEANVFRVALFDRVRRDPDAGVGRIQVVLTPDHSATLLEAIQDEEAVARDLDPLGQLGRDAALDRLAMQAVRSLLRAMKSSRIHALGVRDDDIEGLLELTGVGFRPVADRLIPNLVDLVEEDQTDPVTGRKARGFRWEVNRVARARVRGIEAIGNNYRANERLADAEVGVALTAMVLPSMALPEQIIARLGSLWISAMGAAEVAFNEIPDYLAQRTEVRFALGAGSVLGTARLSQAELERMPDWMLGLQVCGNLLGLGSDIFRVVKAATPGLEASPELARLLDAVGEDGVQALREAPAEMRGEILRRLLQADANVRAAGEAARAEDVLLARTADDVLDELLTKSANWMTGEAKNVGSNASMTRIHGESYFEVPYKGVSEAGEELESFAGSTNRMPNPGPEFNPGQLDEVDDFLDMGPENPRRVATQPPPESPSEGARSSRSASSPTSPVEGELSPESLTPGRPIVLVEIPPPGSSAESLGLQYLERDGFLLAPHSEWKVIEGYGDQPMTYYLWNRLGSGSFAEVYGLKGNASVAARFGVADETGKYVLKVYERTLDGVNAARRSKYIYDLLDGKVPQLEVVHASSSGPFPHVVQRRIPRDGVMFESVKGQVELPSRSGGTREIFGRVGVRIKNAGGSAATMDPEHARALCRLYRDLADNGFVWFDGHLDNVVFVREGEEVIAKIIDQDYLWEVERPFTEGPMGIHAWAMEDVYQRPYYSPRFNSGRIASVRRFAAPGNLSQLIEEGRHIWTPRFFMTRMLERWGWIYWDEAAGRFIDGALRADDVRAVFGDLDTMLPFEGAQLR